MNHKNLHKSVAYLYISESRRKHHDHTFDNDQLQGIPSKPMTSQTTIIISWNLGSAPIPTLYLNTVSLNIWVPCVMSADYITKKNPC